MCFIITSIYLMHLFTRDVTNISFVSLFYTSVSTFRSSNTWHIFMCHSSPILARASMQWISLWLLRTGSSTCVNLFYVESFVHQKHDSSNPILIVNNTLHDHTGAWLWLFLMRRANSKECQNHPLCWWQKGWYFLPDRRWHRFKHYYAKLAWRIGDHPTF